MIMLQWRKYWFNPQRKIDELEIKKLFIEERLKFGKKQEEQESRERAVIEEAERKEREQEED